MYAGASESHTASLATAWASVLVLYFSANAMAANNSVTGCCDCDRPSPDLDISVDTLSVGLVEHITVASEDDLSETMAPIEIRLQSDAPIMSLSPRVATMLDKIFEDDGIFEDNRGAEIATAEFKNAKSAEASSPLADGQTTKPLANDDQEIALDRELKLPELQRRMYRRDI